MGVMRLLLMRPFLRRADAALTRGMTDAATGSAGTVATCRVQPVAQVPRFAASSFCVGTMMRPSYKGSPSLLRSTPVLLAQSRDPLLPASAGGTTSATAGTAGVFSARDPRTWRHLPQYPKQGTGDDPQKLREYSEAILQELDDVFTSDSLERIKRKVTIAELDVSIAEKKVATAEMKVEIAELGLEHAEESQGDLAAAAAAETARNKVEATKKQLAEVGTGFKKSLLVDLPAALSGFVSKDPDPLRDVLRGCGARFQSRTWYSSTMITKDEALINGLGDLDEINKCWREVACAFDLDDQSRIQFPVIYGDSGSGKTVAGLCFPDDRDEWIGVMFDWSESYAASPLFRALDQKSVRAEDVATLILNVISETLEKHPTHKKRNDINPLQQVKLGLVVMMDEMGMNPDDDMYQKRRNSMVSMRTQLRDLLAGTFTKGVKLVGVGTGIELLQNGSKPESTRPISLGPSTLTKKLFEHLAPVVENDDVLRVVTGNRRAANSAAKLLRQSRLFRTTATFSKQRGQTCRKPNNAPLLLPEVSPASVKSPKPATEGSALCKALTRKGSQAGKDVARFLVLEAGCAYKQQNSLRGFSDSAMEQLCGAAAAAILFPDSAVSVSDVMKAVGCGVIFQDAKKMAEKKALEDKHLWKICKMLPPAEPEVIAHPSEHRTRFRMTAAQATMLLMRYSELPPPPTQDGVGLEQLVANFFRLLFLGCQAARVTKLGALTDVIDPTRSVDDATAKIEIPEKTFTMSVPTEEDAPAESYTLQRKVGLQGPSKKPKVKGKEGKTEPKSYVCHSFESAHDANDLKSLKERTVPSVIQTAYKSPFADIIIVLPTVAVFLVQSKDYGDSSKLSEQSYVEELLKMGFLPVKSGEEVVMSSRKKSGTTALNWGKGNSVNFSRTNASDGVKPFGSAVAKEICNFFECEVCIPVFASPRGKALPRGKWQVRVPGVMGVDSTVPVLHLTDLHPLV